MKKENKISSEEFKKLKELYKKTLQQEKPYRSGDDLRLKNAMEHNSKEQFESLQAWVSNNLKYLKQTVTYLGIFATDELSKTMIKTLLERLTNLEKEFNRISKPKSVNAHGLPFNPSLLIHIRQNVLPLVGQIIPLKNEIEGYSSKFFK